MKLVVRCAGTPGLARSAVLADVAALAGIGERIVLVHGGGDEARPAIVTELQQLGTSAVGLSGLDGRLVGARRRPPLGLVGKGRRVAVPDEPAARIVVVRPALLELLLDAGFVPVVSGPALDPSVGPVSVDSDRLAAALAGAARADRLVLLTAAAGLLRRGEADLDDDAGVAEPETKAVLRAARQALDAGVPQVLVAGEGVAPVRRALAGRGTTIVRGPETMRAVG